MYGEELEFEKPIIELEKRIEELKSFSASKDIDLSDEIKKLEIDIDFECERTQLSFQAG